MSARRPRLRIAVGLVAVALVCAACGSSAAPRTTNRRRASTTTSSTTTTDPTAAIDHRAPCGATTSPATRYSSVVVFSFEDRTWDDVGPGFGPAMPYLHGLGTQCSWFPQWSETDPHDKSLAQYVGQVTGARQPGTVGDCKPSTTCSTTADNLFRQLRVDGRRGIDFVEGATAPCSADGNAAKHIPALYLWDPADRAHCAEEVRPLTDLDVDRLPAFAFVTPTLCNDGHDCSDAVVDTWARDHIQPVLDSPAYHRGEVAVFVWYDESAPVPNLWIAPTAAPGDRAVPGSAAATLRAWQSMLGVGCLADACTAPDLRAAAHA
jgi:hypothetical protein